MDFYAASGNTANTSHSHSDYILYLYDIRTSNNKTGTVADSNTSTTTIKVGSNTYFTNSAGAVAANTLFPRLAQEDNAYNGATITVTTPILNKMVMEDLDSVTLEDTAPNGVGTLILEQQTSANGVANVTDTRVISSYVANTTEAFVNVDTPLSLIHISEPTRPY